MKYQHLQSIYKKVAQEAPTMNTFGTCSTMKNIIMTPASVIQNTIKLENIGDMLFKMLSYYVSNL